jgi:hypothetical protein
MEAEAALHATTLRAEAEARPYPPSWFDRLLDWVEGLPSWWVYLLALLAAQLLYVNALLWLNGKTPVGSFDLTRSFFAALVPYVLAFWIYLRTVARQAFRAMRPALDANDGEAAQLEYELVTLPARSARVVTAGLVVVTGIIAWLSPDRVLLDYADSKITSMLEYGIVLFPSMFFSLFGVYRAFHQLREVNTIYRWASHINLYYAAPLYAFSGVTARIAIGLLAPAYFIFAARPEITLDNPALLGALSVAVLIAIAAFVLPLREIHARLVLEKGRLLGQVDERFAALVRRLHARVDAGDLDKMDDLNKALASLQLERQALERIPTWPWERGTLTGFATAVILPVLLWLATSALGRWLGF